jgi:glycosyltransferase involved in cell wall biosynthesis
MVFLELRKQLGEVLALMAKPTLAIISSYDELCGNASYAKALADALSEYYDVTAIPLNTELLRPGWSKAVSLHVREICEKVKSFDYVNIQFEPALFGAFPADAKRPFFKIARCCRNLVLTMHFYQTKAKYPPARYFVKPLLKLRLRECLSPLFHTFMANRGYSIYDKVVKFCQKNKIPIIIHTQRHREMIRVQNNYDLVFDHPLCFYKQSQVEATKKRWTREKFCQKYNFPEDKTYVGVFGFISAYKGYETALKALCHLPSNYHLIIFGSQHPHSIQINEQINPYIGSLLNQIHALNIKSRVQFCRIMNDEDFLAALLCCDFNVLPYFELNQCGSGIAALSLETNSKAIFSQNKAFLELEKYAQNAFQMFAIGNDIELANTILNYKAENFNECLKNFHQKFNIQTSVALYNKLLSRNYPEASVKCSLR